MKRYEEKKIKKVLNQELVLPEKVNERIYETYQMLGGTEYHPGRRRSYRKWMFAGTAAAMLALTSLGALAAGGFFTKNVEQSGRAAQI